MLGDRRGLSQPWTPYYSLSPNFMGFLCQVDLKKAVEIVEDLMKFCT